MRFILTLIAMLIVSGCDNAGKPQQSAQLIRAPFVSEVDQSEREYFVYLPKGYDQQSDKTWPVMLFLHGNGGRGNGRSELGFVMSHGPLYETWIQKRDLPFIIIAPQLPMLGMDQLGISYIDDRQLKDLPKRLENGTPERSPVFTTNRPIIREASTQDMSQIPPLLPRGWEVIEKDLIAILDGVEERFNTDPNRIYLTGLSYGGFGTWYMASQHPQRFAAIVPVVGWGHPDLMAPIAKQQLPVWAFAGGRDSAVQITNFYAGLDKLEQLGHQKVRFTVHEDMEHDAWTRVYRSTDLYDWLLQQTK
ncbi:prolyl oligopeptidase family serine peptidase [Thalassotalea sp. PS06]|uniref:carboxylesterase family protein n=1 Tax=Thalassotalea sp. PS06 TaxID=2594005 RepID=UPI001162318E|nr:prolyl oligopeptidase family serine peptidase [Thalassotalea sp. PS06]QDP01014.1 prolyl oligopeptidase family serine peptidase [Thalassotalea sp. PS06]